jgi:hypothetical protein
MIINRLSTLISFTVAGMLTITSCSHILSNEAPLPASHPEALGEGRVGCNECHEDQTKGSLRPQTAFNHTTLFVKNHRFYAGNSQQLCSVCHAASFCTDCHSREIEMKPSIKLGNRPDRELIHRGDYLTRHKIEGKLDPTGCYRCHGRTNNEQCRNCHK